MRVGLICPYSLSIPGGVQGQVMGLARSLRILGDDVRVLAPTDGPPPDAGVTPLGSSVPFATNGSVAPIAPDPSCALRTIRALRDEEFDVVHLHEPLVPGPSVTSLLFADAPKVGTFHRAGASTAYNALKPVIRRMANRLAVRCAVSEDARALAHDAVGGDFEMLFNGIEVDHYAKATPAATDRPTILFLGRHEPRKGLAVLLEAVQSLDNDVRVWVGSDGPQTAELKARYGHDDRIEWLGRIDDDAKASYLAGADVFCAPSLMGESFGVVLLEAMAAGTAIVATELPGYRNVARPDEHAVMVPVGDAGALSSALRGVLGDGRRRAELVDAGRQRAEEFSMLRLAEAYQALYRRAAGT